jgi:hypothetical protein
MKLVKDRRTNAKDNQLIVEVTASLCACGSSSSEAEGNNVLTDAIGGATANVSNDLNV